MGDTLLRQWTMLRAIPCAPRRKSTPELVEHLRAEGFDVTARTVQHGLNELFGRLFPTIYDDPLQMALQRMDSAELTDTPTHTPSGFDLDDYLGENYLDFRLGDPLRLHIRINSEIAKHLEETPLAEDQHLGPDEDGWRELTATVSDTPSCAGGCGVLGPGWRFWDRSRCGKKWRPQPERRRHATRLPLIAPCHANPLTIHLGKQSWSA